jgi:hypothetical protein
MSVHRTGFAVTGTRTERGPNMAHYVRTTVTLVETPDITAAEERALRESGEIGFWVTEHSLNQETVDTTVSMPFVSKDGAETFAKAHVVPSIKD